MEAFMEFRYTPELADYIRKHKKKTLLVEMIELNNTDLEITELHAYFINERMRDQFINKKQYRVFPTELGEILLPRFPLELEDTVTFGLKSFLFFKQITYQGIKV